MRRRQRLLVPNSLQALPLDKKTTSQIEKETLKKRISNVEVMYFVYFIKK